MPRQFYPGAEEDAINWLNLGLSYAEIADMTACGCTVEIVEDWVNKHDRKRAISNAHRGFDRTGVDRFSVSRAEFNAMVAIYHTARVITRETGQPYEVDHIKEICDGGTHCLENLRIVPRHKNRRGPKKKK